MKLKSNLIDKSEVVTNEHHSPSKVIDGVSQGVDCLHVQMIGRFVK